MIIRRLRLKITCLVALIVTLTIGIYILWPDKSQDVGQITQRDDGVLAVQPNTGKPQPKRQLTPEDFQTAATSKPTW